MHQEVLDEKNRKIFSRLGKLTDFYLSGGTALALQIGHRISVDFDLFSDKEISKSLFSKLKAIFDGKQFHILVNNTDELTVTADGAGTKLTFLHYPFPAIRDFVVFEGTKLLGIEEIAATKAYTIGRRGSFKDYVDLYFVVFEGYSNLPKIIEIAEKKYGDEFNARLFLEQLLYLDDVEDAAIIFLKKEVVKKDIVKFFENEIKKIQL